MVCTGEEGRAIDVGRAKRTHSLALSRSHLFDW